VRITAEQLQAAVSVGRVVWAVEVVSRYMPGVKCLARSGSGYTGTASPLVTKLTSALLLEARRVTSPRLGRKSGQDCQRWIKRSVALYPTPIAGGKKTVSAIAGIYPG